jgi:hypothetical protein
MRYRVNDTDTTPNYSEETLTHCLSLHNNSHVTENGSPRREAGD